MTGAFNMTGGTKVIIGNGATINGNNYAGFHLTNAPDIEFFDITINGLRSNNHGTFIQSSGGHTITIGDNVTLSNNVNTGNNNRGALIDFTNGTINIGNNVNITGNYISATTASPGAIYLSAGTINITTQAGGTTVFNNPTIDINQSAGTNTNINGAGGTVIFESGIRSGALGMCNINKTGGGTLIFGTGATNTGFYGTFNNYAGTTHINSGNFFAGITNVYGGEFNVNATNNITNMIYVHGGETNFWAANNTVNGMDIRDGIALFHEMGNNITTLRSAGGTTRFYEPGNTIDTLNITRSGIIDMRMHHHHNPHNQTYNILTVNNFNATGGVVYMNAFLNGAESTADVLRITGISTGDTQLRFSVRGNGEDFGYPGVLVVDQTGASSPDTVFTLFGGVDFIERGAWKWELTEGLFNNNWYLTIREEGEFFSNPAMTTGLVPHLHLATVHTGMNELRRRLGALRSQSGTGQPGVWARSYARHMEVSDMIDSHMNMIGIEAGIDWGIMRNTNRFYAGIMAGYMTSERGRLHQTNGFDGRFQIDAPSVGAYATWLHRDGWFVDATARGFFITTDIKNYIASDVYVEHTARRDFVATSLEGGRRFTTEAGPDDRRIAFEPKIEVRYAFGTSTSHTTNLDDNIEFGTTHSLNTRAAIHSSFMPRGDNSAWMPFIELGLYHEWLGTTDIWFGTAQLPSDHGGMGFDVAVGTNLRLNERSYLFGDINFEDGQSFRAYGINFGARFRF